MRRLRKNLQKIFDGIEMLASFPLKDVIITLDALHCQTKTAKAIKDSGNEYVLQVKNNQKNC